MTNTKTKTMTYTFREHPQRALDLWPETWHLRHWFHFWQLRTTILTFTLWLLNKEWWWQHSQFLRCFIIFAPLFLKLKFQFCQKIGTIVKNIARIANAVPCHSLFKGDNVNVNIVVLNCQKCNQCLKCQVSGHKKSENFQKIWKISKNLKTFQKSENFLKI